MRCDKCDRPAVANGTDGERKFKLCADHYLTAVRERERSTPAARAAEITEKIR